MTISIYCGFGMHYIAMELKYADTHKEDKRHKSTKHVVYTTDNVIGIWSS
jgi:hypothetical protein